MSSPLDDMARDELRILEVTASQIARLEGAFPLIEVLATRTEQAPIREVRETLDDLKKCAQAAERLTRRLCPPSADHVATDASLRLQGCLFDAGERDPTEALLRADGLFRALADAAGRASSNLPQEQSRKRVSGEPVHLILRALEDGWGDDWVIVRDTFAPPPDDPPEIPELLFSGKRGAKERLKRVVQAIYDQIGRRAADGLAPAWERSYRRFEETLRQGNR